MKSEANNSKGMELMLKIMQKENCTFHQAIKIVEALDKNQLLDVYLEELEGGM